MVTPQLGWEGGFGRGSARARGVGMDSRMKLLKKLEGKRVGECRSSYFYIMERVKIGLLFISMMV